MSRKHKRRKSRSRRRGGWLEAVGDIVGDIVEALFS